MKPLNWDFCIECNGRLTKQQIDDDDTFCSDCIKEISKEDK